MVKLSLASSKFKDNLVMILQQAVLLYPGVMSEIIKSTVQDSLATSIFSLLFSPNVYIFSTAKNYTLLGGNAELMAGISSQIHFIHSSYTFIK